MKTLSVECPDGLADRLEQIVREGWVADQQQAMIEALRRFLDSHLSQRRSSLADRAETHAEHWGNRLSATDVEGFTGRGT